MQKKIVWINVDDAVIPSAAYFVGGDYRENGMKAAHRFEDGCMILMSAALLQ